MATRPVPTGIVHELQLVARRDSSTLLNPTDPFDLGVEVPFSATETVWVARPVTADDLALNPFADCMEAV